MTASTPHQVVIIGAGFGGLFAAKALRRAPVEVTVVDRTNHHLFQPLLYQVATGILSEGDIAPPTRDILRHQENTRILLGDVADIDLEAQAVVLTTLGNETHVSYDSLIVAAGASQSYFGHDEFMDAAPGMKTIDDALEIRGRIFGALEMAELTTEAVTRQAWLTFVVIGAGPTGVELAGQIAELSRRALKHNFRTYDVRDVRVILLDGGPTLLSTFAPSLQRRARRGLERLGVEVRLSTMVIGVDETGVDVKSDDPSGQRILAHTKIWAAGVQASPLGRILGAADEVELDRAGHVKVKPDCTLPGHPEVFVVGDMMALDGLPGVAEVAMQSGHYAAKSIKARLRGKTDLRPFRYLDLGTMATVSRFRAVVEVGRFRVSGFVGWLMWLFVHLTFMTGFKNRASALVSWMIAFVGRDRRQRTITAQQAKPERNLWTRNSDEQPARDPHQS